MEAHLIETHFERAEFEYNLYMAADGYFGECRSYTRPIVTRVFDHRFVPTVLESSEIEG